MLSHWKERGGGTPVSGPCCVHAARLEAFDTR